MDSFVKKITCDLCWLRAVDREVPILRVQGIADRGYEEMTQYGRYVRWRGRFAGIVVRRPEDVEAAPLGLQINVQSYAFIPPAVVTDWMRTYFRETKSDRKPDAGSTATGVEFDPEAGLDGGFRFVVDVGLQPSKRRGTLDADGKPDRGYEYVMRIAHADPRYNPMAGLEAMTDADALPGFGMAQLSAA